MSETPLRRTLGFWALLAYGVGDILGAGIYVLVGEVAGTAGSATWIAFGVAMAVAGLTALSYAELVSRFPRSAGEAIFCEEGLRSRAVATLVGWLVLSSGVVSLATVATAFAKYVSELELAVHGMIVAALFLLGAGAINFAGIRPSSRTNIVCTVVEVSGLLVVLVTGAAYLLGGDAAAPHPPDANGTAEVSLPAAIGAGAALAFFAFIGFEDLVNVAEEAKEPRRDFPRAILLAVAIAGVGYMVITTVATHVVPPSDLAQSEGPLLEVVRRAAPSFPEFVFVIVSLFAIANTGLLNFIMASRLLYGMGRRGLLPRVLSRVHERRRTPHWAILTVLALAIALALTGALRTLAGGTSGLILIVFATVNLSLIVLKWREARASKPDSTRSPQGASPAAESEHSFRVPVPFPVAALLSALALLTFVESRSWWIVGGFVLVGAVIAGIGRLRGTSS